MTELGSTAPSLPAKSYIGETRSMTGGLAVLAEDLDAALGSGRAFSGSHTYVLSLAADGAGSSSGVTPGTQVDSCWEKKQCGGNRRGLSESERLSV